MKHEIGLFVDGHQIEPTEIEADPNLGGGGDPAEEYDYYRVPVGVLTLHFFLDAKSSVKIDSTAYLDLEIEEDNEDHTHAWVTLNNSHSYRDSFTGHCALTNTVTNHCTIVNSSITRSSGITATVHPLINLNVTGSRLENAVISDGSAISNSSIINSTLHTDGPGAEIEGSTVKNSSISSKGVLYLEGCKFNDANVHVQGFLRIVNSRMNELYLKVPDCHIPDRLYFFAIDLPSVSLYVYQTGTDDFAITRHGGGFNVEVEDPEFRKKLLELLDDVEQALPEDTVDYITDAINSRRRIIQILWAEFERKLGDPI